MQIDKWKERIDKLQQGDRLALSQVLTEIETNNENTEILSYIYKNFNNTTPIVGVTGFPGAGKSTQIGRASCRERV